MKSEFSITFLGTGTSQGVPVIGCNCKVCISNNEKDNRLRSSLLISINGKNIVVDSGPDFRQQMLRNNITDIRAILFTHEHKDHVAGLDDVRPYNYIHDKPIDIYAENRVHITLKREFAYIFSENPYPGIPRIEMHLINEDSFNIDEINIIPIRAYHHKLPVLGFRVKDFVYLTDVKTIPENEFVKLIGVKVLVINSLRKEEHISHLNLQEAIRLIEKVSPDKAYLTHLSHRFGLHEEEEERLPSNISIAYDGLKVVLHK